MKVLSISRNKLEIDRAQLRKPLIVIGRSPTCDVVLRAPGIKPVHFIVEWIGGGVFDVNSGAWSIVDVSAGNEAGEGLVLTKEPVTVAEFSFRCEESHLESSEKIGGRIVENISQDYATKSEVLEFVQVRTDSGAIENVLHYPLPLKKRKVAVQSFKIESSSRDSEGLVRILLEEMPGAELFLSGRRIDAQSAMELGESDLLQVKWRGHDFYLRFVEKVDAPPIPQDFWGDPLLKKLTAAVGGLALLLLIAVNTLPDKVEEIKEPPRVARVEVPRDPPPPPDQVASTETMTKPDPVTQPQAKAHAEAAKAAAPSVVKEPTKKPQAGLNSQAKFSNVNQVGVLGALSGLQKKGKGVSADQVLSQGVIHETASAQNDAKIVLKNPPSGVIGSGSGGSPNGTNTNQLTAASSTLSGVTKAEPASVGPFARKGGSVGFTGGTGLTGREGLGGKGIGDIDSGEFSVAGGGLDRETVRKIILSYRGQIRTCYERAMISNSKLQGRIVYNWRISPQGSVSGTRITRSTIESPSLRGCVLEVVQSMVFPKAPNGQATTVIYPFIFQGK